MLVEFPIALDSVILPLFLKKTNVPLCFAKDTWGFFRNRGSTVLALRVYFRELVDLLNIVMQYF